MASTLKYNDIKDYFEYDSITGIVTWKKCRYKNKIGKEAGWINNRGYRRIYFKNKPYFTHRIAWCLHTKKDVDPTLVIMHGTGGKLDNSIKNIKLDTHQANSLDCKKREDNTSGVTGVSKAYIRKSDNKQMWRSFWQIGDKQIKKTFDNFWDAVCARKSADARNPLITDRHGK